MTSDSLHPEQEREIERLTAAANLQRMRGQWTDAEDACRKALSIAPNDVVVREMLGDILHECGKLDLALSEYRTALDAAPGKASLETKYAKVTLEIAERERERAIAEDMLRNPRKYTVRERSPVIALLWAVIVPGLGQFYNGDLIKAGVIFGSFLLFVIAYATLQPSYPHHISSLHMFLVFTSPVVLVIGILAGIAYIYGLIDAPIMADKSNKAAKESAEP